MTEARIALTAEDKTRAAFESAKAGLQGLQVSAVAVTSALSALGVAGAGLGLAIGIKGAIDQADALNKLSQRTGIATEALSQLQFAAKLSDVSAETLTTGIKKLNVSIAEGLAGEKEKVAMFKALGVTLTDAAGKAKSADQVLLQMADTFSGAKDGAAKTALAVGLLGKAGDEMIPLLNGGSGAITDMMKKAQQLGLTIGSDFAKQSEEFNDNLTILKTSSDRLAISMAGDLVTGLGKAARAMADAAVQGGMLKGVIAGLQNLLTGDDTYKNNVRMVELTEKLFRAENELVLARSEDAKYGDRSRRTVAAEKTVAALRAEMAATQAYRVELTKVADAEAAAAKAAKDRVKKGKDLKFTKGDDSAAKAAAKELADQARLLAELAGLSGSFADDWDRLNKIYATGKITVDQLAEAQAALLAKQPFFTKEQKQLGDETKQLTERWAEEKRIVDELYKSREKLFDADEKAHGAAKDLIKNAEFELSLLGKTNAEREVAIALRQLEATGVERGTLAYAEYAEALKRAVVDRAELQRQIDDFDRLWSAMDSTARDTFRGIGDGWEGVVKRMRDTLKNTLLDYLYQAALRPIVFRLAANISGAGNTAVGSVAQASGLLGNVSLANTAGTAFANLTGTGLDGLLATNGAFGTAGGIAGAVGSALPWIGGALAIASLFGGGKRGGPKDIGSYGSGFLAGDYARSDSAAPFNSAAANIVGGIGSSYNALAKGLGIRAGDLQSGAMFAIDNKGDGDALTALTTQTYLNGKLVYDRNNAASGSDAYKDVGRSPEELDAAIRLSSARAVLSALKASDLPEQLASYFDALDPLAMNAEQITAALDLAKAAQQFSNQISFMGDGLANLANLSVKATTDLAAAAGGMDQLQNSFAAYYQAFYSEDERAAASLASVTARMKDLGYANVDTVAEFRELVESIKPVDDASRTLLATLLNLAPAFAAAHAEAKSVSDATKDAREGLRGLADGLKSLSSSVASAEADIASLALQNQIDAANAANAVAEKFGNLSKSLRDFVNGETLQPSALFGDLLKKALGGDAEAMQALPGAATSAIDFAGGRATNAVDFARERAITLRGVREAAEVSALLATKTVAVPVAEDPMAVAIKNLGIAIGNLQIGIAQSIGVDLAQSLGEIDTNLSGSIDLTEFGSYFSGLASDSVLTKIFNEFDSDGSGFISRLEAIKVNTASFASAIANDPLLMGRMQFDFDKWFKESKVGDVATIGAGGPTVTKTGAGSATLVSASGTTKITAGSSIIDLAASDPSLGAAWKKQYGPSQGVATAELARAASDARAWITTATPGSQIPWMGGVIKTNGSIADWHRANGTVVTINPKSGDDIRALAESYPELLSGWRAQGYKFANGGVFSNSIITRPTNFSLGQMGEAGPEAIMPLTNIGGSLGVRVTGNSNDALMAELRALRDEVVGLRAEARATAANTNKTAKILGRVTQDGESITTTVLA